MTVHENDAYGTAPGSDTEFTRFAEVMWPRFVRAGVLMGATQAEAEDAAQDALMKCLRSWARVSRTEDPVAYSVKILQNTVISRWRRRSASEVPTPRLVADSNPSDGAGIDDAVTVRAALTKLPLDQRTVLVLRYYLDLTEAQVATVLGVPAGTVKSRTHRAMRQLEHLLTDPAAAQSAAEHQEGLA
jgi:RNA polymerase sigma-70 factor (sigma-E family)